LAGGVRILAPLKVCGRPNIAADGYGLENTTRTEGAARARLQEFLNPINETAGFRQTLPTDFKEYVTNVLLPQRRKKWKVDRQNYSGTFASAFATGLRRSALARPNARPFAAVPRQQDQGWFFDERCEPSAVGSECGFKSGGFNGDAARAKTWSECALVRSLLSDGGQAGPDMVNIAEKGIPQLDLHVSRQFFQRWGG
jgi:hypothetical protein